MSEREQMIPQDACPHPMIEEQKDIHKFEYVLLCLACGKKIAIPYVTGGKILSERDIRNIAFMNFGRVVPGRKAKI